MEEYNRIDAAYYDCFSQGLDGDAEFYVEEARRAGSPVLEIACGTGRITIPVAQAGVRVVGLDLAPNMLKLAEGKIAKLDAETRGRIRLVQGDMRDFALDERFNLVMIPYRAFLHMPTPEDQRRALLCIREHLVEGGRLVLNFFDPSLEIVTAHMGSREGAYRRIGEFVHPETKRRVIVSDCGIYDPEVQLVDQHFVYEELDDEGTVASRTYAPIRLRWLYRYEAQYLFELCGYEIEALYGDFRRGPFRYGKEQIWVLRKK